MISLKSLHRQRICIFLALMLFIGIAVINILAISCYLRVILIFLPYIFLIWCLELWINTWGKIWIISSALLLVALLLYSWHPSAVLLLIHVFLMILMIGMVYFYNQTRKQERQLYQLHLKAMRVLLRKNPPLIQTIDYTCEAVIIVNNKGHIIESNPQSSLLLSLPESSLIGKSISSVLGIFHNFQPSNKSESGEFTFTNQEEGTKHLRFITRPLLNGTIPPETLIILFDISEEKRQSDAYLQAAKLSVIGQVSAGLAHEIRNPLTTIKGFMQLITPQQWPESFQPYQQLVLKEIETIDQLLNKFVLVTSPSAPKMQPVNLTETIHAFAQTIQSIRLMHGINLALELPAHPVFVMGDPEQLYQALLSLVNNAIEASPNEGQIIIRLSEHKSLIRIGVKDNGPGIPESLRHRVLEPFFTTQKDGTGLGLTITQQIVLAHHGKLHFSEEVLPCGTEVMIDLPNISNFTNSLSA